ncbi:hypothetical protein RIF29_29250 [Crotalaria pallida]|uniref:Uncharacterized protein n=1 Tax=Crotalaria pallida TaxID=3830 RepID=A0AAN9EE61_CROPI
MLLDQMSNQSCLQTLATRLSRRILLLASICLRYSLCYVKKPPHSATQVYSMVMKMGSEVEGNGNNQIDLLMCFFMWEGHAKRERKSRSCHS